MPGGKRIFPSALQALLNLIDHGINAIQYHDDGSLSGAACWRADGTPVGLARGLAHPGVRFGLA
jgi:hypothetical protein